MFAQVTIQERTQAVFHITVCLSRLLNQFQLSNITIANANLPVTLTVTPIVPGSGRQVKSDRYVFTRGGTGTRRLPGSGRVLYYPALPGPVGYYFKMWPDPGICHDFCNSQLYVT